MRQQPEGGGDAQQESESDHGPPVRGRVAVIGAGVSGLAAALRLRCAGVDVDVFEAERRVGGRLLSLREAGFQMDAGANTMAENEPLVGDILRQLQLDEQIAVPEQQGKRFVVRHGRPVELPASPAAFLRTPLLSTGAKLRLLAEPFLWRRPSRPADQEESVRSFMSRHIGEEAVDYIVDPFCAGVFASPPEALSMRFAFPAVWELEQRFGSLLVGAVRSQLEKAAARRKTRGSQQAGGEARRPPVARGSFSFQQGMQQLPLALAARLPPTSLHLSSSVCALCCDPQPLPLRCSWAVQVQTQTQTKAGGAAGGAWEEGEEAPPKERRDKGGKVQQLAQRYDAVISTVPLSRFNDIRLSLSGRPLQPALHLPRYLPMALVFSAYKQADVAAALRGFGVLVPSKEARRERLSTLGTIFSSSLFPSRAPPGCSLFTSFVGGAGAGAPLPAVSELRLKVHQDLQRLLRTTAPPVFSKVVVWRQAFPQYSADYGKVLASIEGLETTLPFFYYAGNHTGSLAVGSALLSGHRAAERLLADLHQAGGSHLFTMA